MVPPETVVTGLTDTVAPVPGLYVPESVMVQLAVDTFTLVSVAAVVWHVRPSLKVAVAHTAVAPAATGETIVWYMEVVSFEGLTVAKLVL